jgi:hypothetical protein
MPNSKLIGEYEESHYSGTYIQWLESKISTSRIDTSEGKAQFEDDLRRLLNRYSEENPSNTPDYLLARFLSECLKAYNQCVFARDIHASTKAPKVDPYHYKESCDCELCVKARTTPMPTPWL